MWKETDIRESSVTLDKDKGKLQGKIHLKSESGDREFNVGLLGFVETNDGAVTRFDVVAKGNFQGEGQYTRGAPKGKFPLGIALTLADGSDTADGIPPQGSRGWLDGYIK